MVVFIILCKSFNIGLIHMVHEVIMATFTDGGDTLVVPSLLLPDSPFSGVKKRSLRDKGT
jgi:hypothetical protein